MNPLIPLLGAGVLLLGALAFWQAIQNWLANVLARAREQYGVLVEVAQSALVIIDRVMVNGQRLAVASVRVMGTDPTTKSTISVEDVKRVREEDLPSDVRRKLQQGRALRYELSVGSMKVKHDTPTYRLVIRGSEQE